MPQTRLSQVWKDGVKIDETSYTVTDAQLRGETAQQRLVSGRTQLRQIRTQAQAASDATGALTLAQLTTQFRQIAGAVAILAQTLMDVELVLALHQDDGSD